MSNHCPSHDWDAEYDRQERSANAVFMNDLREIAIRMMAGLAANPNHSNLAYDDMAQAALEMAAAMIKQSGILEGWFYKRGDGKGDDWESIFWHKNEELMP